MPSLAYTNWREHRQARIERIVALRQNIPDLGEDSLAIALQLDRSLVLHLAAEFQGFARDLHNLATNQLVECVGLNNTGIGALLGNRLRQDRKLDRGNANPASLGSDFERLGLGFWPAVRPLDPGAAWQRDLWALNRARNAIAHANEDALASFLATGYRVDLDTVLAWKNSLDDLARAMDDMTSESLADLLGGKRPW